MKKLLMMLAVAFMTYGTVFAQQLAFPGAEGFGKYVTGGRGGKVYYVTRNDDCSDANLVEGTLRWALRSGDDTPRTILFKTSGTIYLTSVLKFDHPNVTIEGQTAPGGGVCVAGYKVYVCKPNVIIRHMRFRPGDLLKKSQPALDVENTDYVIIDHCSMTWSMEECLTMYDCDYTTVQWCIIGEGLYNSKNSKGARAYATQWGGEHGTMHHCLFTNCNNRTPRFNGVRSASNNVGDHDQWVDNEFINNVIFNWGKPNSVYGGECDSTINNGDSYNRTYMVNNFFRPGPLTQTNVKSTRYFAQPSSSKGYGQWYLSGNKFEVGGTYLPDNKIWHADSLAKVNADNLYGWVQGWSVKALDNISISGKTKQEIYDKYILKSQDVTGGVTTETADEAFVSVTAKAGASLPRYDEVDRRLLDEAAGIVEPKFYGKSSSGSADRGIGIINSPSDITLVEHDTFSALDEGTNLVVETTMWPYLGMRAGDKLAEDTDGDGLPDAYEEAKGFNKNDASDGAAIASSGYSNLEEYLNGVADGLINKADYETVSGISAIQSSDASVVSHRYYSVSGERVDGLKEGVNVVVTVMSDGSERVTKVLGR